MPEKTEKPEKKALFVHLDPSVHARLKLLAITRDTSAKSLAGALIAAWVAEQPPVSV